MEIEYIEGDNVQSLSIEGKNINDLKTEEIEKAICTILTNMGNRKSLIDTLIWIVKSTGFHKFKIGRDHYEENVDIYKLI